MIPTAKMISTAVLLLVPGALAVKSQRPDPGGGQAHRSGLEARITLPDGTARTATLQGLGCTASICSRVAIKGQARDGSGVKFWLDNIAAINDINENDALILMKNGTAQRIRLITDFRVLYLGNQFNRSEKLDLTRIKSLEFLEISRTER
jgi:hypothetical protein